MAHSTNGTGRAERVDAVVVGARCAGSAVACVLARAGRDVVVLDRATFPSDTLSTHVLLPDGVADMARIGALERLLALRPARSRFAHVQSGDAVIRERWRAVDGIDYGVCIPRDMQDQALVDTVRAIGGEIRERCTVQRVLWSAGRACGVTYHDDDGREHEIRAKLVVGADGRRSTVAAEVGAWTPYRSSRNGRGMAFRYMDDPLAGTEWHETMSHWREGDTIGFTFPCCPEGRLLVLFMGPAAEIVRFRRHPDEVWEEKLWQHTGGLADRVHGATNVSKLRSTAETGAYFRSSSGPGWALAGDAGHFKDPVIGQGMRDAVHHARCLGEAVVDVLDDAPRLDVALRRWEYDRDRDTLPSYHWANRESRPIPPSALVREVFRTFAGSERPDVSDTFNRTRSPERVLGPAHLARGLGRALAMPGGERRIALVREAVGELPAEFDIRRERVSRRFRWARQSATERTGWTPGPAPQPAPAAEPHSELEPEPEPALG